jgi:hypothetical protein
MLVKFPIPDMKEVIREIRYSEGAGNLSYKSRILSKYIWVQKDLGDVIVNAEYSIPFSLFRGLYSKDITIMESLQRIPDGSVWYTVVSKDYLEITAARITLDEAISSPLSSVVFEITRRSGVEKIMRMAKYDVENAKVIKQLPK